MRSTEARVGVWVGGLSLVATISMFFMFFVTEPHQPTGEHVEVFQVSKKRHLLKVRHRKDGESIMNPLRWPDYDKAPVDELALGKYTHNVFTGDLLIDKDTYIVHNRKPLIPQNPSEVVFYNAETYGAGGYVEFYDQRRYLSNRNWEYFLAAVPDAVSTRTRALGENFHQEMWTPSRYLLWKDIPGPGGGVTGRYIKHLKGKTLHLYTEWGDPFESFVNNELPGIILSLDVLLADPSIKILVQPDPRTNEILSALGISGERIIPYDPQKNAYIMEWMLLPFFYPGIQLLGGDHFAFSRPIDAFGCARAKLIGNILGKANISPPIVSASHRHSIVYIWDSTIVPELDGRILDTRKFSQATHESVEKKLGSYGYTSVMVDVAKESFESMTKLLRDARVVIGYRSAALSHLIVAPPGLLLIEVGSRKASSTYYELSANLVMDHVIVGNPEVLSDNPGCNPLTMGGEEWSDNHTQESCQDKWDLMGKELATMVAEAAYKSVVQGVKFRGPTHRLGDLSEAPAYCSADIHASASQFYEGAPWPV
eukprot:GFYU01008286.1.p1 GENE.GFYU01008286.1~~GFYU01008286.1.p1  ORF type:complete len:539 (-),score=100.31 GFYU01008286.1:47-1663(-)